MKKLIVPTLVAVFGLCWLLAELQIFDIGKMMWTIGLLGSGVILLTNLGFSKSTFVIGMMLIIGSIISILRFNGIVTIEKELPILIIILGALMGINTTKIIPHDKNEKDGI